MRPPDLRGSGDIWVAIPAYNNRDMVRGVAAGCLAVLPNVIVVDDGSTDGDTERILDGLGVTVLRHERNRGKGAAILTASRYAEQRGGRYLVTIDADGQHDPADLRAFIPLLRDEESAIVIGVRDFDTENVPASSRFGRTFANFWLRVETGVALDDCQSGFRAYPVRQLNRLRIRGSRYDFEAEVLARASWAGLGFRQTAVSVRYPKPEERVSSFRPFMDNLRLTHTHALLVLRRLLPWRHRRLVADKKKAGLSLLLHPRKFFGEMIRENATPGGLALAAAVGTSIAAVPMPFHTGVIFYVASRLRLNLLMALNIQHLCMPPFVPALCIEVGHYLRTGRWLTDLSFESVFHQFASRLLEWFLGSVVIAPLAALFVGSAVYGIATILTRSRARTWLAQRLLSSKEETG